MGRRSEGYLLTNQCKRIELKYLLKMNILKQGIATETKLRWNDDSSICIKTKWSDYERYLILEYTHTDYLGNKSDYSYRVNIITRPSNLGKGQILLMVCPVSLRPCRKLFMAYGSPYFKSIKAYQTRIYYTGQLSSKLSRANDRYWQLLNLLEKTPLQRNQSHYNGIETKRSIRTEKMYERLHQLDLERWYDLSVKLKEVIPSLRNN